MRIVFVRHGKDDDAYRGGWSSLGLLDEGKRQSQAVADYFRTTSEYKIEYIVSSDLNRTIETAEYIASALDLPIHTDTRLRECNNGDLAGILNSEALVKFPGLFWNTLAMDEAYPNGESPVAFYLRIKEWFDDIIKSSLAVVMGMSNVEKSNIHMYKLSLLIAGTAEMEDFLLVSNMNILIFKNLRNLK